MPKSAPTRLVFLSALVDSIAAPHGEEGLQLRRPRVWIGSSAEGRAIANHFQTALEESVDCEVSIWNQGTFRPSTYPIQSLLDAAHATDFAVLVASADDVTTSRGATGPSPRDNVLFELGLFMGVLGVGRVFILCPAKPLVKLPSDLNGLAWLRPYRERDDGNLTSAVTGAVLDAERAIRKLGPRDGSLPNIPNVPGSRTVSPVPQRPLATSGLDRLFANMPPGRFATHDQNRPALHLRAVWRPAVESHTVVRLTGLDTFRQLAPTALLETWHSYYARHTGVGGPQLPQLNADMTHDATFVVEQDCARSMRHQPEASVRAAVALLDGGPSLRFVADLSLGTPTGRLIIEDVLASLRGLAVHASETLTDWFVRQLHVDLPHAGVLELHALATGAVRPGELRDSLDGRVDLTVLGDREKGSPIRLAWVDVLSDLTETAITHAVVAAFAEQATNWGYFSPPPDLGGQLEQRLVEAPPS